jgi:hypothetical protein
MKNSSSSKPEFTFFPASVGYDAKVAIVLVSFIVWNILVRLAVLFLVSNDYPLDQYLCQYSYYCHDYPAPSFMNLSGATTGEWIMGIFLGSIPFILVIYTRAVWILSGVFTRPLAEAIVKNQMQREAN